MLIVIIIFLANLIENDAVHVQVQEPKVYELPLLQEPSIEKSLLK